MAELNYAWWKKNKPLTLVKEPLSDQLKKIEKVQTEFERFQRYKDAMFVAGSMAAIKKAIDETSKKCNKILHKNAIKHLAELRVKADDYHKTIGGKLKASEKSLNDIRAGHKIVATAANLAAKNPTTPNLTQTRKAIDALCKLCNTAPYVLDAYEKIRIYGEAGIGGFCDRMMKLLKDKSSGKDVTKEFDQCKKDLEKNVVNFAAIKVA